MAKRPVFVPCESGPTYVRTYEVEFEWFPGMALKQAQRSVASLHAAARTRLPASHILEISTKSESDLGVRLSAFNLTITTVKHERTFSVESAYQASKVFQHGGPFVDLLETRSVDAKRDPRLKESGSLIKFHFFGKDWGLEPRTAFYDWLYMNALHKHVELSGLLLDYDAFSDIAFNPERSLNCQAYAAALYVALSKRGLLSEEVLKDKDRYLEIVRRAKVDNAHQNTVKQDGLAF